MNGFNRNEKNRMMPPEKILEMFLEVVNQHASKSYDFPVSNLLDQYMKSRIVPNFPEAGLVIQSAGQIFSRKVDYLECLLMAMHDKQNAPNRTDKSENADEEDRTEKKRLPGKRLKNINHTEALIQLGPPKKIKKSANTVEKMNLNTSDTTNSDRFMNYCQVVKSKTPVFYERINLLLSEKADNCFDGSRPISNDDPDRQKNYNVFIGCISFKDKQLMSQREFMNRIPFDTLDGGFEQNNEMIAIAQGLDRNSTELAGNELLEQSAMVDEDVPNENETDLLEQLRENSLFISSLANKDCGANDDCDSVMVVDDVSQLNSTADGSTIQNSSFLSDSTEHNNSADSTLPLNSTLQESEMLNSTTEETQTINESMNQSIDAASSSQITNATDDTVNCDAQTTIGSTLNESEINSTMATLNANETNLTNVTSETNLTNVTSNDDTANLTNVTTNGEETQLNLTCADGTLAIDSQLVTTNGDETQLNLTCADGTLAIGPQLDPLNSTNSDNEMPETTQNNSGFEEPEPIDTKNIFRISQEFLKLNEAFRLPLNVLQKEVNITLNLFGIPFGRLRRQVKFALPKDFDPMKMNKRARDMDECSTTTGPIARKFVKLTDGTATPTIEVIATSEQTNSNCDLPNVPASDTNTAQIPLEASSQTVGTENGTTADCIVGDNLTKEDYLGNTSQLVGDNLTQTDDLGNTSQLVDGATGRTQDSAKDDFGISDCLTEADDPTMPKIPRIDSQCDVASFIDSGIGTEESQVEGEITTRRISLHLTPPTEEIENAALVDDQSANRVVEMTNLSVKVHSWHQRLKPILLHSEKRNDFDVRDTSRNIVSCFSNCDSGCDSIQTNGQNERIISFEQAMANRDKADTARYFFAMLQMANNSNIQIIVNHNDSSKLCPQDKIMMKLLNPNLREIHPNIEKN